MAQFLILMAIIMVTVSGDEFLADTKACLARPDSQALIKVCKNKLSVDPGHKNTPIQFYDDSNSAAYCRSKLLINQYIEYATCYKAVHQSCYKESGIGNLVVSDSDFKSAINYFCDRVKNGFHDTSTCVLNQTELGICSGQTYIALNLKYKANPTTYEDKRMRLCGASAINCVCFRDSDSLKDTCPESVITYVNALKKSIPSACKDIFPQDKFPQDKETEKCILPPNGCDGMVVNYMSMIIVAFSVLLFQF